MRPPALQFRSFAEWVSLAEAQLPCPLKPYVVKDPTGRRIEIAPSLSRHQGLLIPGADWIPIRAGGEATVEQMVHTPSLYLPKARNVRRTEDGWICTVASIRDFPGDAVLVGGSTYYYHWLIDYLPRWLLARAHAGDGRGKLIVNRDLQPFQRQSLSLLGVEEEDLLPVAADEAIRPRATLVPSLLASTTVPHPAVPGMLRTAFHSTAGKDARVYLSRQDAASRLLSNEAELTRLLEDYGFRRYVPGSMTFEQQVAVCAGARALVAVHGAAMTNMVFCPPGAKIVEIFTPLHRVTSMFLLARACGHEHRFVPARTLSLGRDNNPLLGNWEVDLDAMAAVLEATLA
jgi:capsular polysaccharide biosynthesis protein